MVQLNTTICCSRQLVTGEHTRHGKMNFIPIHVQCYFHFFIPVYNNYYFPPPSRVLFCYCLHHSRMVTLTLCSYRPCSRHAHRIRPWSQPTHRRNAHTSRYLNAPFSRQELYYYYYCFCCYYYYSQNKYLRALTIRRIFHCRCPFPLQPRTMFSNHLYAVLWTILLQGTVITRSLRS